MNDHEGEPVRGLPERPPAGEQILWQGTPCWRRLSVRIFHARALALYFGVLMAWRLASSLADGTAAGEAVLSALLLLPVLLAAAVVFALLGWLISRATVYTITTRRLVLRTGVALPISINIPFCLIDAAHLKSYADGTGDISVTLTRGQRVGYLLAWPHVRPWRLTQPEPALRSIPTAAAVAQILTRALAQSAGSAPRTGAKPADAGGPPAFDHAPLRQPLETAA